MKEYHDTALNEQKSEVRRIIIHNALEFWYTRGTARGFATISAFFDLDDACLLPFFVGLDDACLLQHMLCNAGSSSCIASGTCTARSRTGTASPEPWQHEATDN